MILLFYSGSDGSCRVATGYGQPPSTLFDWTLSSTGSSTDPNFWLPPEIKTRLDIEKFCDKVSKSLYINYRDPVGLLSDEERFVMSSILSRDFEDLDGQLKSDQSSMFESSEL